jgi:hypothetical protein
VAFGQQGRYFRIDVVISHIRGYIDHAGLHALADHILKIIAVEGNNQTIQFLCQGVYSGSLRPAW